MLTWKKRVTGEWRRGWGKEDVVFCLTLKDGSEVWQTPYACEPAGGGHPGPRSTPALDGECVYTLSNLGHLLCLHAATGAIRWQKNVVDDFQALNVDWGFSGSPRVSGDMLIINAGLHGLALNKNTGEKIWGSPAGRGGYATPVIIELATGEEKWNQKLGAAAGGLTAVKDRLIILTERGDLFIAEATPSAYMEIASAKGVLGPTCRSAPVFCRGMILCRNSNGDIACIDVSNTR